MCAKRFSLTEAEIRSIAATAPRRYFVWTVPKKSGGTRLLCHPARELKRIQRYFNSAFLCSLPVHCAATAYQPGSSIRINAELHSESRAIVKLDFSDFFSSVSASDWVKYARTHFTHWNEDDLRFSTRILFWGKSSQTPTCLAIGAPTSPKISNALLYDVDVRLNDYACEMGFIYSRYADDITFSSKSLINLDKVKNYVKTTLDEAKYTQLRLNDEKTRLLTKKHCRRVTGLVITPEHKVSIGRERKRLISSMCHRFSHSELPSEDRSKLRGLIAFALDAEPSFVTTLRRKYGSQVVSRALCESQG
ncbi:retron St85 family RNA-directed DNA polymerase [Chthonobacter albigriseus]|uniref:retron St85 family RNA-directed DNA polymerase n=1 Tax=Chthonobacter albigriseus TaxID=1683161 RepID=UPI003CC7FB17